MFERIKKAWDALTARGGPMEAPAVPAPAPAPAKPDIGQIILEQLKERGIIPADASVRVTKVDTRDGTTEVMGSAGPKFDSEDAERRRREGSWEFWSKMMVGELAEIPAGWALCRIGSRNYFGQDAMSWVYGAAKGAFGLWATVYQVCDDDEGISEYRPLWALTNLRNGLGMGLFADIATAVEAADHINNIMDWRAMPDASYEPESQRVWRDAITRVHTHWTFVGIDHSKVIHCHIGPERHGVWVKEQQIIKPEILS